MLCIICKILIDNILKNTIPCYNTIGSFKNITPFFPSLHLANTSFTLFIFSPIYFKPA